MNYLLSIVLVLCCSSALAFPPGFIGFMASGGAAATGITDDFSSDSSSNYTSLYASSGITVSGGVASGTTNNSENSVINNTPLSASHYAQADVQFVTSFYSGVIIGASAASLSSTGHAVIFINNSKVSLFKFSPSDRGVDTGKYWSIAPKTSGNFYKMRVEKNGDVFSLYIDDVHITPDITDTSYTGGTYIGLVFSRVSGATGNIDNFSGGSL